MTLLGDIGHLLLNILRTFVSRQCADELKAWLPSLVAWLINRAVSMLPESDHERYGEEWRSHVNDIPGNVGKIWFACGLLLASYKINAESRDPEWPLSAVMRTLNVGLSALILIFLFPVFGVIAGVLRFKKRLVFAHRLYVDSDGKEVVGYSFYKTKGAFGSFLQKTGLCELPFLISVARGHAAIIGRNFWKTGSRPDK